MAQIFSLIFLFLGFACSAASKRTLFKPPVPPWKKLEEDEKEQKKKNEMMKGAVVKVAIDTLYAVPLALNAGLGEFSTGVKNRFFLCLGIKSRIAELRHFFGLFWP